MQPKDLHAVCIRRNLRGDRFVYPLVRRRTESGNSQNNGIWCDFLQQMKQRAPEPLALDAGPQHDLIQTQQADGTKYDEG